MNSIFFPAAASDERYLHVTIIAQLCLFFLDRFPSYYCTRFTMLHFATSTKLIEIPFETLLFFSLSPLSSWCPLPPLPAPSPPSPRRRRRGASGRGRGTSARRARPARRSARARGTRRPRGRRRRRLENMVGFETSGWVRQSFKPSRKKTQNCVHKFKSKRHKTVLRLLGENVRLG